MTADENGSAQWIVVDRRPSPGLCQPRPTRAHPSSCEHYSGLCLLRI